MIAEAQKRIEWESKCILHRFSWHHKDALEYLQDCRQDSYDLVITAFLLAYIKTDKLFKLIAKVTKPGARLMILTTDYDRLKKFEVIFFWGFLLWHLADIKWWIPLFSQVQFTPPLKKIIKDLNKNGFSRVQVKREDAKIQFPDFADVIKWMDESGFATEYFDLAREGKREKMANAFMNWAEKKKINYFGQVGVRGKPFLLTWPINVIIAEK
jgi:ubiquinone/menaquinone biosynthesis C-methylase UbiE